MSGHVTVGVEPQPELPVDRLDSEEVGELRRLLGIRQKLLEQAKHVEQDIQLLVLAARDKRGLQGVVKVDPENGRMWKES